LRTDDGFLVVQLVDGSEVPARAIVLATGAEYRRPDIDRWESLEGNGIYYAATETEAGLCAGAPVVVLGGGNSAGQAALFLAGKGCAVHVVIRGPDLGRSMSQYLVTRLEADPHVTVLSESQLVSVHGAERLDAVGLRTVDGSVRDLPAAAVFCFIGAVPATSWLQGLLAVDEDGFIRTDRDLDEDDLASWAALDRAPFVLETSLPGVFAAGDVRAGSVKRVAAAVGEGSTAVRSVHQYLALAG
jgi:thioredoxin reductase (NADPH)